MTEKRKTTVGSQSLSQTWLGGQFIGNFRFILLLVALGGMLVFYTSSRPLPESVGRMFQFDIPASARDFGFYYTVYDDAPTIATFIIDDTEEDLFKFFDSYYETDSGKCLIDSLEYDYMPDFSLSTIYKWWQPQSAKEYEGAWCYQEYSNGRTFNNFLLLDYSISGQIKVYVEEVVVDNGQRIPLD